MKRLSLLSMIIICSLFLGCQNNTQEENYAFLTPVGGDESFASASNSSPIEMKPMRDPKTGRVTSYVPYPADWNIVTTSSGTMGIEAPNGIQINSRPTEIYYFNVDPYVAQMAGKKVANPVPLKTIFRNNLVPEMQQQGAKLLKQYPLQNIAQRTQQLMQGALNRSRVQSYDIIASEWQQSNGQKTLILLTQMIMHSQGGSSWAVGRTLLNAPSQYFESAKETYLFAQANWEVDRNTAMAHAADLKRMDQESERRMAQSRAAHNARMRSNEAAFQAQQKAHNSTYSDISDMSMQGYKNRSEMQDRMRNKENNMIHEEYTMTNPWDNRSMQVQSGYQNYYINSNGDVIGSNDANFNPNIHKNFKNTEWRKMPKKQW